MLRKVVGLFDLAYCQLRRQTKEAIATWKEVRRDQASARTSHDSHARHFGWPSSAGEWGMRDLGEDWTDSERVDAFDDLLDADEDATEEEGLAIWADLRRRQGEAAAHRLEEEGPGPEWLATLNSRLDTCASDELKTQSAELEKARAFAHRGITTLLRAKYNPNGVIRNSAEEELRQVRRLALPDRQTNAGNDNSLARVLDLADGTLRTCSARIIKRDSGSFDSVDQKWARHVRSLLVTSLVVASVIGAAAMSRGAYAISMGFLLMAVVLDMLEGSVGRITATETPVGRWVSCMIGHLAEYTFVAAIAADQMRLAHPGTAFALLG